MNWFRLVERCPRCRLRFERENDFFLGAYVINLGITEGLLAVVLLVYLLRVTADSEPTKLAVWPVLSLGLAIAVGAPILFFPFSRTIWAAIDLAMRPVPPDDPPPPEGEG